MNYFKSLVTLSLGAFLFAACSSDDAGKGNPSPSPEPIPTTGKYYVMSVSEAKGPIKNGFLKQYASFPQGTISNTGTEATAAGGMGGYRQFGAHIYRRFNDMNQRIIGRFEFDAKGFYTTKVLSVDMRVAGSGNFTINKAHTDGFYFDGATPTEVKVFDPVSMVYKRTLGNYKQEIDALAKNLDLKGVKFTAIGQQFLVLQDNLLYANITFATSEGAQAGMFDSASKDVHLAVIDVNTGKWLGTTSVKDTGNIAFVDENPLSYFDEKGDLYFVCQGVKPGGLGGKSKIARIEKGKTTVDQHWELNFDTMFTGVTSGKFSTIFVEKGKIITLVNAVSLTNPQEINITPIWKYVSIDIKTKAVTPIALEGVTLVHTPAASLGVTKIDGKYLLRVVAQQANGYYSLSQDFTTAHKLIEVKDGGMPQGIFKTAN